MQMSQYLTFYMECEAQCELRKLLKLTDFADYANKALSRLTEIWNDL